MPASTSFSYSLVICVRLHENNPWVLDRIRLITEIYDDLPPVVIVDYGSEENFSQFIISACDAAGFLYVHVSDYGTFSLSHARNVGLRAATTEYVMFSDIDFFFLSNAFRRIESLISNLKLEDRIDQIINFPVCHLSTKGTSRYLEESNKDGFLDWVSFNSTYSRFNEDIDFCAPYSNIIVVHKLFYELVGGYNESFRGHGSEDFEFLVRVALHTGNYPEPVNINEDRQRPKSREFFGGRRYAGFRSLCELICLPTELTGLKAFHLDHPRLPDNPWVIENDLSRARLNAELDKYHQNRDRLLLADYLPRPKLAICICVDPSHAGYFFPLRLAGYRLHPIFNRAEEEIEAAGKMIDDGTADCLAVFNPYMRSHASFRVLFDKAKAAGVKVVVVERGALPSTIYYGDDVCYIDPAYSNEEFEAEVFTQAELDAAATYISDLRAGDRTLEKLESFEATAERLDKTLSTHKHIVFVPLQLDNDMAVTMFKDGFEDYVDFIAELLPTIEANPDILFVVKPHPLSVGREFEQLPNLFVALKEDNVHYLIDRVDVVVCYNSGVGLLALLHQKPVVTVGNAFYNYAGVGYRAATFAAAVAKAKEKPAVPDLDRIHRLCAWFLFRKYSSFIAEDDIRETKSRSIHAYRDLLVTEFRLDDLNLPLGRQRQIVQFSPKSYGVAKLGLGHQLVERRTVNVFDESVDLSDKLRHLSRLDAAILVGIQAVYSIFRSKQRRVEIYMAPDAYLASSKHAFMRWIGERLFRAQ